MSGGPRDLDDESMLRIARSFYVVKMARYAALVVAALAIAALADRKSTRLNCSH